MIKKFLRKLFMPVLIVILTLLGNYTIQAIIQSKGNAVLAKNVIRTDLSGLPLEIQKQVPLIPVTYSLENRAGGPARNVTILVKSDSIVSIADLKFSAESETHQIALLDPHTIKVDLVTIRPGGLVGFQIITTTSNQIKFSELSDNAKIVASSGVEAQNQKNMILEYVLIAIAILLWLALIATAITVIWRVGKSWQKMETTVAPIEIKGGLIILIVSVYIYNTVTGSFGPLGGWLPIPRISFDDFIGAFLFYLLVTRYKLIETWILAMIEKQKRDKE